MVTFRARSAAKINLTLDILRQRADGYHELASVVHTVGIWDEIELGLRPGADVFTCNRPELETSDNLCLKALRAWRAAAGVEGEPGYGATIHLRKTIPTGAGLGGGSGNAAAILKLLNRISACRVPEARLSEIGAKLGADVPLFLRGAAVLMEGIGEKLTPLVPLDGWVTIVKPEISFPTPTIYRAWDEARLESRNDTPKMLENWQNRDLRTVANLTGNDLEQAAAKISAVPAQLVALLLESGALGAQMSGSGSACFGIFEDEIQARQAESKLRRELAKWVLLESSRVFVAPFCERGVEIAHL